MQLDRDTVLVDSVGVGAVDLAQEREELLVAVSGLERGGDFPVAISNAANRVVVPCR